MRIGFRLFFQLHPIFSRFITHGTHHDLPYSGCFCVAMSLHRHAANFFDAIGVAGFHQRFWVSPHCFILPAMQRIRYLFRSACSRISPKALSDPASYYLLHLPLKEQALRDELYSGLTSYISPHSYASIILKNFIIRFLQLLLLPIGF